LVDPTGWVSSSLLLRMEANSVSELLCFLVIWNSGRWGGGHGPGDSRCCAPSPELCIFHSFPVFLIPDDGQSLYKPVILTKIQCYGRIVYNSPGPNMAVELQQSCFALDMFFEIFTFRFSPQSHQANGGMVRQTGPRQSDSVFNNLPII
jgi:hypothetical protein